MLIIKVILQLVINVAVVLIFLFHPDVRKYLKKFPIMRALVYIFFGASLFAQSFTFNQYKWPKEREWFPFTRWAMFAGSKNSVDHIAIYEWQGVQQDGLGIEVNPAKLFLTTNATAHFTKTKAMGKIIWSGDQNTASVDLYAKAILDAHNMKNDHQSIVALRLWRRIVSLEYGIEVPSPYSSDSSQLIYTYKNLL